jgi:hypothetical protein
MPVYVLGSLTLLTVAEDLGLQVKVNRRFPVAFSSGMTVLDPIGGDDEIRL